LYVEAFWQAFDVHAGVLVGTQPDVLAVAAALAGVGPDGVLAQADTVKARQVAIKRFFMNLTSS